MEREARLVMRDIKDARRAKDGAADLLLAKWNVLRDRELVLRRLMDAIVYIVCGQYVWFVRRLYREGRPSADPETLMRMVDLATHLTHPDDSRLCLAADLTTTVQIGDIMEITFDARLRTRVRLCEIKEGPINELLTEKLGEEIPDIGAIRRSKGKKVAKQAERMLRQRQRMRGLQDIVQTREGIDPRSGRPLFRTADGPDSPGYQPILRAAIEAAHRCGEQIVRLDNCLILAVVRADGRVDTSLPGASHGLFHFRRRSRTCLLGSDREPEELASLRREPQVFDFVEYHLTAKWDSPLFAWGDLDRVCDLVFGRIKIFAQFDVTQFAELAKAYGITIKRATSATAKAIGVNSGRFSEWWAIGAELPNGVSIDLISGDLQRIFLELARPRAILQRMLASADEIRNFKEGRAGTQAAAH